MGPVVVASTLGVFATGVALLALGPRTRFVLPLHKASFLAWLAFTAIHVLAHVPKLPRLVAADWRRGHRAGGPLARRCLLSTALVAGVVVAVATLPLASPWLHHH